MNSTITILTVENLGLIPNRATNFYTHKKINKHDRCSNSN